MWPLWKCGGISKNGAGMEGGGWGPSNPGLGGPQMEAGGMDLALQARVCRPPLGSQLSSQGAYSMNI